ncbi:MAG: RsmB/NOP family class I SAM-dependent RNA methyltransferase [Nanoarchaeota archaeon]
MTQRKLELKPLYIERIKKLLSGKDFQEYLEILNKPLQNSIRCNTLKISPKELKQRLEEKNWKISQPWKDFQEVMIIEGKYVTKEEADEIEKKLMNKGIKIDIKKNFDDKIFDEKVKGKYKEIGNDKPTSKDYLINSISISERGESNHGLAGGNKILINLEPGELGRSLEHLLGYYYVQELASMLSVIALNPEENEIILDLCAAPGSKTTQMAASLKSTGAIIANEVNLGRIKILASNLERCGVSNAIISRKDGIALCKRLKNMQDFSSASFGGNEKVLLDAGSKTRRRFLFDRILVDAPCSGEGTMRSSSKTALMWNPKAIKSLSRLQKALVEAALEILKPKGTLIYSTCTHAPEENEEVVNYILNEFKEMKIEKINLPLKSRPGITSWQDKNYDPKVKQSCRIYPHDNNTEGFFVAKFIKTK